MNTALIIILNVWCLKPFMIPLLVIDEGVDNGLCERVLEHLRSAVSAVYAQGECAQRARSLSLPVVDDITYVWTEKCKRCVAQQYCSGKSFVRLSKYGLLHVCDSNRRSPLDAYDLPPVNEIERYFYDGVIPQRYVGVELERKFWVKEGSPDVSKVFSELEQEDEYWLFPNLQPPHHYVRIRRGNVCTFEYHKVIDNDETREFVTTVDNVEHLRVFLRAVGGEPDVVVRKRRREVLFVGDVVFPMFVDEVEGLGTFIEIESLTKRFLDVMEKELRKHFVLEEVKGKGYPDLLKDRRMEQSF